MRKKVLRAFRNSYLAALLILTSVAQAQVLTPVSGPGQIVETLQAQKALMLPGDTIKSAAKNADTCRQVAKKNGVLYEYSCTLRKWIPLGGASSLDSAAVILNQNSISETGKNFRIDGTGTANILHANSRLEAGSLWRITANGADDLEFFNAGGSRTPLYLGDNGAVGINNTNPVYGFDMNFAPSGSAGQMRWQNFLTPSNKGSAADSIVVIRADGITRYITMSQLFQSIPAAPFSSSLYAGNTGQGNVVIQKDPIAPNNDPALIVSNVISGNATVQVNSLANSLVSISGTTTASLAFGIGPYNRIISSSDLFFKPTIGNKFNAVFKSNGRVGIGDTARVQSTLHVGGSFATRDSLYTATATLSDTVHTAYWDISAGDMDCNLPNVTTCDGREYRIIVVDGAGSNFLTIKPFTGQTINGNLTTALSANWQGVTVKAKAALSGWVIVSKIDP